MSEIRSDDLSIALRGWRFLWDEVYRQGDRGDLSGLSGLRPPPRDPALNLAGWLSSYTGLPIREAEMREWVERTFERLVDPIETRPRMVLEIGCGTGMFLLRLARVADQVIGLDFSSAALDYVRGRVADEGLDNVALHALAADQLDQVPDVARGSLDLVVVNSVAQYFPDAEYFAAVVERALRLLAPGGRLFLGDLRSRALLPAFHLSVLMQQADDATPLPELAARLTAAVKAERELTFDPAEISALAERLTVPTRLAFELKRGRAKNELTRFRYDAVLRIADGSEPTPTNDPPDAIDVRAWGDPRATPAALRRELATGGPRTIELRGVPNARLVFEVGAVRRLAEWLENPDPEVVDLAAFRARLATRAALEPKDRAVEPEEMWALAQHTPYRVTIRGSATDLDRFDVTLTQAKTNHRDDRTARERNPQTVAGLENR